MPTRVSGQFGGIDRTSIPVRRRPFPFWGSTDGKQTLNGLFYVIQSALFSPLAGLRDDLLLTNSTNKNVAREKRLGLDLDFYPTGQVQLTQRIYRTAGRRVDVQ